MMGGSEVVDRLFIEETLPVGATPRPQEWTGNFNNARIVLSYWVVCANGFTGYDCSEVITGWLHKLSPTVTLQKKSRSGNANSPFRVTNFTMQ